MQLSYEDILEYKQLYYKHYGERLSDEEAENQAENLIHFFSIITQPPPAEKGSVGVTAIGNSTPLDPEVL